MHLRDGKRRLGFVLGAVGAVLGGLGSFNELKPILNHYKFEALAGSETVKREGQWYMEEVQRERTVYFEKQVHLQTEMPDVGAKGNLHVFLERQDLASQIQLLSIETSEELFRIEQRHSNLHLDGIERIRWTDNYGLESIDRSKPWPRHPNVEGIETQAGQILAPTPSPSAWEFLLVALFPPFGFLIGWGAVWAIAWVGASLAQQSTKLAARG